MPNLKLMRQSFLELSVAQSLGYQNTNQKTNMCKAISPLFFEKEHREMKTILSQICYTVYCISRGDVMHLLLQKIKLK